MDSLELTVERVGATLHCNMYPGDVLMLASSVDHSENVLGIVLMQEGWREETNILDVNALIRTGTPYSAWCIAYRSVV